MNPAPPCNINRAVSVRAGPILLNLRLINPESMLSLLLPMALSIKCLADLLHGRRRWMIHLALFGKRSARKLRRPSVASPDVRPEESPQS